MRQIGTLPDGAAARRLADYLLTLKIETRLEQQPEGWLVWVCDEDRVPQAREALAEFQSNPTDTRFAGAAKAAHELRLRELAEDEEYRERLTEFREKMTEPTVNPRYATVLLVVIAVIVTFVTHFGEHDNSTLRHLLIASTENGQLTQVGRGEVWRLITPIFIHFDYYHLLFNCLVIYTLAGQVERFQGSPRLIWLVFLFALLSNLAQFYLGHPLNEHFKFVWARSEDFGGLSGVGYGLFGYVWMKSRLEPASGLQMSSLTVFIMVGWFFACLLGLLDHVANAAHGAGLVAGLIIGAAPQVWQVLRHR